MNIYHSFWEKGYNTLSEDLYNMHLLSVLTSLKNYGNIHLITTEKGKEFLKGIPYTSIELFEDNLPEDLKHVWSLSKIYAYKQIAKKKEPFFHIDYDVFLFKKLPTYVENAEILVQHWEDSLQVESYYNLKALFENCPNLYFGDKNQACAYNMGIFGGNNTKAIKSFAQEAIIFLTDAYNIKKYWKNFNVNMNSHAVVLEQWYVKCYFDYLNTNVEILLKSLDLAKEGEELGYVHLMGAKNIKTIHKKIKHKILEYSF